MFGTFYGRTISFKTLLIATTCLTLFLSPAADARSRGPTPTPTPTPVPSPPTVTPAITAYKFLDSLGVNTHFDAYGIGNAYENTAAMESELAYLGVRYSRDHMDTTRTLSVLQKVHQDTGIKYDILMDTDVPTQISWLQANTSMVAEVEGANEIDFWPVTYKGVTGPSAAVAFQTDIYKAMKASPSLASFPVDNLTIAQASFLPQVGNLASVCDYSASHIYPQYGPNSPTMADIDWSITSAATDAPGKPKVVTEFGWWTQPMTGGVTLDVHAKFTLNFFFDAFIYGAHRSYVYELNDEYLDPKNSTAEDHFGLFQANGAAKPAAVALHNMTTILADKTPLANPSGLAFSVSGASNGATIYKLLMQRGDGVFILALWQDPDLWDYGAFKPFTIAAEQALVNFGITAKTATVYDPMLGTTATASYTNVGGLTQMVPDHPIFIFIQP